MEVRKNLHFKDIVINVFSNIQKKYNLSINKANEYIVKYSNNNIYLNIYHEKISYEIYFEIGKCPENVNNKYNITLNDIIEIYSLNINKLMYATTFSETSYAVNQLLIIIESRCTELLSGNDKSFELLLIDIEQRQKRLKEQKDLEHILKIINEAWEKKDFKLYIYLCEDNKPILTNLQKERYKYAIKKIRKESN